MTWIFNPRRDMAMIRTEAKIPGQQTSVGLKDRMETNGRTDGQSGGHDRSHYLLSLGQLLVFLSDLAVLLL